MATGLPASPLVRAFGELPTSSLARLSKLLGLSPTAPDARGCSAVPSLDAHRAAKEVADKAAQHAARSAGDATAAG